MQSLTNTNGNNQGMPTALPTVTSFGATFISNTAANQASTPAATTSGVGNNQDNNDVYGSILGNTAPVLADTAVTLNPILEDALAPTGAVGTLISNLAAISTNITDPDTGAVAGIAITAADTTNGSWFYSTNGGTNWNALGSVSNTNARLLQPMPIPAFTSNPAPTTTAPSLTASPSALGIKPLAPTAAPLTPLTTADIYAFSTATDTAAITVTPSTTFPASVPPTQPQSTKTAGRKQ
jgi:hypothetical protein